MWSMHLNYVSRTIFTVESSQLCKKPTALEVKPFGAVVSRAVASLPTGTGATNPVTGTSDYGTGKITSRNGRFDNLEWALLYSLIVNLISDRLKRVQIVSLIVIHKHSFA
jgi:hypothetical protein